VLDACVIHRSSVNAVIISNIGYTVA